MPGKFIRIYFVLLLFNLGCQKKVTVGEVIIPQKIDTVKSDVSFYLTTADRTSEFKKQNIPLNFSDNLSTQGFTIEVNDVTTYQTMEGFGYTLTGGSASLINSLDATIKENLLKELFSTDGAGIGISYIRISLGASDLSFVPYTYDDISPDKTDLNLASFSLDRERADLIPILKKITEINPQIKILASPWSAPLWMKTNGSFVGGKLKPEFYGVYADYFVRYIQAMKAEGIVIDAITPQNEPLHPG
ncbi:MAG: glucosylceramidase, partial [Daejeonella sp.]